MPEQWRGVHPIYTLGGAQKLFMLSEQGLNFFLGPSDKPKALPFQIWLSGEALPAIRKHGRYQDTNKKFVFASILIHNCHEPVRVPSPNLWFFCLLAGNLIGNPSNLLDSKATSNQYQLIHRPLVSKQTSNKARLERKLVRS